jgi:hypothetical protein
MLIDRTQRSWGLATALLMVAASVAYLFYARSWPGGPSGRTWPGMWFGIAATACMAFAALLAVRKKTVRLRMGSLSWWLRGHLWLGTLSVPLVFYHAAFRWGGTLEILLWLTLAIVIVSGIVGVVLQSILPRMMKLQLSAEIIPDQLNQVCRGLVARADELVHKQCGSAALELALRQSPQELIATTDPAAKLAGFYLREVRPYLGSDATHHSSLADLQQAQLLFERVRSLLPYDFHEAVNSLESTSDERRQWSQQMRLYGLLHGWLKIHVPCSVALGVFVVVHVATALYY